MIRSVLSILAGIAVLTVASFAIEAALNPLLRRAFPETQPGSEALSSNPWSGHSRLPTGSFVWPPENIYNGSCRPVATGSARGRNGQHSGRSHDCGSAVASRKPRFTVAVVLNCHPEYPRRTRGRISLQRPQNQ
jgi:hypothetical protein